MIKDSQKYIPEFLDDIIEKNLNCINFIKTPNDSLPLFNGAASLKISQIDKYLENSKTNNKDNNLGGLFKIKHKNHFLIIDIDKPPQKNFLIHISQDLCLLRYFFRWYENYN